MNKTIGILAHVDAGKTTLSEQILYHAGVVRARGRVDHQDAFLDHNALERRRGITIFSGQAAFTLGRSRYTLVDTPGHADFAPEMERALGVLDYAVLVVSCVEGVQGHTETIWRLLRARGIPTLLFLNKTDRAGADPERALRELRARLSPAALDVTGRLGQQFVAPELLEEAAALDDALLERYLADESEAADYLPLLRAVLARGGLFPVFRGSALRDEGVWEFLEGLELLTETAYNPAAPLAARVYQVRHDQRGGRLAFLKVEAGTLRVKEELAGEKVDELRVYSGEKYVTRPFAEAGELCAALGLSRVQAGDALGAAEPSAGTRGGAALTARVLADSSVPPRILLERFRILEDEDPALDVTWVEQLQELHVGVMGPIQLEVLREVARERFGMEIEFGPCEILYRETIAAPVVGYGHFEPLRHYAEVHLRLAPGPRGSGVVFDSACPGDFLAPSWQHLVATHVMERQHKGILTGSPLTDVRITLLAGKAHEKHTEGGDFREATYRAVRQGLEQAESLLLEPYYSFTIDLPGEHLGRALTDVQRMKGVAEPPELAEGRAVVRGRAPVATMQGYSGELAAYSRGLGYVHLALGGYEPCHNTEEVTARLSYDKIRDLEHTSDSVFCSHGAGFNVRWDEVPRYIHIK